MKRLRSWSNLSSSSSLLYLPCRNPFPAIFRLLVTLGCLGLLGCPQENSPLQGENQRLKKQVAKQESLIASLQEGNTVMQQQINLLNQEAREANKKYEQELQASKEQNTKTIQNHKKEESRLRELETENKKLAGDARWLRTQREQMRNALKIRQGNGKTEELPFTFPDVQKVSKAALTSNGYAVLVSMQTDQKAVYVTERKTSTPASLEVFGFRNQYFLVLEKQSSGKTKMSVKADFEKLSQKGTVLAAGEKEQQEIELRLIHEIQRRLENGQPSSKKPQKKN